MNRRCTTLAIAAGGCLAAVLFAGCSVETRQKILPFFFDGVTESPPPPPRRVRRDLLREIEELKRELAEAREAAKARKEGAPSEGPAALPIEQARTWHEAARLLPTDKAGGADWIRALETGTIAPRPGLDPKTAEQGVLPLDVDLTSSASKFFSVTFPHAPHTRWLTCANCHPAIFPLGRKAAPTVVTMARIQAGQYCGACHGRVAFGIEGECARCHTGIPARADWPPTEEPRRPIERAANWNEAARLLPVTGGGPDWAKALAEGVLASRPGLDPKATEEPVFPLDVELIPPDNPLFRVVFPHGTHTAWLACTNCHPGIFPMAKGADPITMEKILGGQYCGTCHGKVAFPVTACGRCHPALAGGS